MPAISTLGDALEQCPGPTGELARHLNSLQETDQPGICLASALSFMSVVRSGRIKSSSGLSPNIYTLVLGRSGSGKTRCQQRIIDICILCNFNSFLMGKPASDSGILKGLQKQPRQLLIWDEFGQALNEISHSTSSYRAAIVATIMEIYSANGRHYVGKEYATQDRVDIPEPYLSIAAASTMSEFYSALTMQFLEKGFLSRWIVIEGNHKIERKVPVPTVLTKEFFRELEALEAPIATETIPVMSFEDSGMEEALSDVSWLKRSRAKSEIAITLRSRAYENATKLCLILSGRDGVCSTVAAQYSWYLTDFLVGELIKRCKSEVHDTHRDKVVADRAKKFTALLVPGEMISKTELYNRAHNNHIRGLEFRSLFEDMVKAEKWIMSVTNHPVTNNRIELYSCAELAYRAPTGSLQVPVSTTEEVTEKIT